MTEPAALRIRIVLVEPSHPGNVGAVARAMKNMDLHELVLVRPRAFPHPEAVARASGATDVLDHARVAASVPEALAGCGLVVATASHDRDSNVRVVDVRDAAARLVEEGRDRPAAILFGNERIGLTNADTANAHLLMRIPANPEYESLNLAQAVQIVAYELYRARGARTATAPVRTVPLAPPDELERLYAHFAQVLVEIDFRDRTARGTHLMQRIRRLIQKAEPDVNEVNILRGILTAVQSRRRRAGAPPADPQADPP